MRRFEFDEETQDLGERVEEDVQRSLDNPMPRDLKEDIKDLIEPSTMNMGIKHGDVMECIDIAYPVIRDYLRGCGSTVVSDQRRQGHEGG